MTYTIQTIAYLKSPYKEKFGIPRQPGLVKSADAWIEFLPPFNQADAFEGLDAFSHIWISFLFHQNNSDQWRPKVRPPRLGGNEKLGVYATRSSFRPNGLGLSAVELKEVETTNGVTRLRIAAPDILDGTPIIDIKPYIPYSDNIENACSGFAPDAPKPSLSVTFSDRAIEALEKTKTALPHLKGLIEETLSLDPRPAYKKQNDEKVYGIKLYHFDIKWQVKENTATVLDITAI